MGENTIQEEMAQGTPQPITESTWKDKVIPLLSKLAELGQALLKSTIVIGTIYFTALYFNGAHSNLYHFDLSAIRDFYIAIVTKQGYDHGVNSIFNSVRGMMPSATKPQVSQLPDDGDTK